MKVFVHLGTDAQTAISYIASLAGQEQVYFQNITNDFYTPTLYQLAFNKNLPSTYKPDLLAILSMAESSESIVSKKIFAIRTLQLIGITKKEAKLTIPFITHANDELRYEAAKLNIMNQGEYNAASLKALLPYLFKFNSGPSAVKSYEPTFIGYKSSDRQFLYTPCDFQRFGSSYDNHFFNSDWILKYGQVNFELALTFLEYSWNNKNVHAQARYLYRILSPDTLISKAILSLFDQCKHHPNSAAICRMLK